VDTEPNTVKAATTIPENVFITPRREPPLKKTFLSVALPWKWKPEKQGRRTSLAWVQTTRRAKHTQSAKPTWGFILEVYLKVLVKRICDRSEVTLAETVSLVTYLFENINSPIEPFPSYINPFIAGSLRLLSAGGRCLPSSGS
jgi:hypothetical protein